MRLSIFFLLALTSCGSFYLGKDLLGADEFVLDSYKIREGKLGILEMEGKSFIELDEEMLEENEEMGEVLLLGNVWASQIEIDGKMRLFDVLSLAKILPDANLFKSYLLREGKIIAIDFNKLMKDGDLSQNIVMRGGDKIYVAEENLSGLTVIGQVGVEKLIPLPSGTMSLRQAIAAAGGITYSGDKSHIQIIRGALAKPKIYSINWEHIIHLPNESLLLMPDDIVYVPPKPILEWFFY